MKTTRRGFFKTAGLGTAAGLIGGTTLITPSAFAQTRHDRSAGVFDNGIIQLSQNESGRGPALAFWKLSERIPPSGLAGATRRIMYRSFRTPLPLISTSIAVTLFWLLALPGCCRDQCTLSSARTNRWSRRAHVFYQRSHCKRSRPSGYAGPPERRGEAGFAGDGQSLQRGWPGVPV